MGKRIVTTDDLTGNVISQWRGGDEQNLEPVAGRTHHVLAEGDTTDYSGQRWNGAAFIKPPSPAPADALDTILRRIEAKLDQGLSRR